MIMTGNPRPWLRGMTAVLSVRLLALAGTSWAQLSEAPNVRGLGNAYEVEPNITR